MKWKYIIPILLFVTGGQTKWAKGSDKDTIVPYFQSQTQLSENIAPLNENSVASIEGISGSIVYSPEIDPSTYTINTNLAVGKTPGNLMVGGSAAYSIPIDIPEGTNGLQPSISLNYSSNFSDGLMGIGWNIGGIPAITRVNKTIYNDTQSDAIRCDLTDKYALNGKRLVVSEGIYGANGTEYRTEHDEFSKISSYGGVGYGPQWFRVYSKDGLIFEYGNTPDSRIETILKNNDVCVVSWRVNRITDRHNNYITYTYDTTDDERPISKIEYTHSTTSQTPFVQILFNYKSRNDISSYVYANNEYIRNILLDNIEVKRNGLIFKKYNLEYKKDIYAHLQKITPYSSQSIELNPQVFAWNKQIGQIADRGSNYSHTLEEYNYFGDFNGDGKDDMVQVPKKTSYTSSDKWTLYLTNAAGDLISSDTGELKTGFETFLVGDFNGDGMTDLMMQQKANSSTYPNRKYYYFYQSVETSFYGHPSYVILNDGGTDKVDIVDYNGDGKLEFLYHNNAGAWNLYTYTGNSITNGSIPTFGQFIAVDLRNQTRFLDFNGDGCSDVLTLTSAGYKVYEFKGANNILTEKASGTDITIWDTPLFGDYNGDGRTDIITTRINYSTEWYLWFLTGNKFQSHEITCFDDFSLDLNLIYSSDMNGDGRTDIVLIGKGKYSTNNLNKFNIALSTGNNFSIIQYVAPNINDLGNYQGIAPNDFRFHDFKGDGRTQIYCFQFVNPLIYSFYSGAQGHLINTIIDNLGAKTTLSYLPMSDSVVYTRHSGSPYPVSDFSSPMQLVSQVNVDNGIGGSTSLAYTYVGAKIHHQGKGFLGFAKVTTTDVTAGIIAETLSGYHSTYYYPQINKILKKTKDNVLIETISNTWSQKVLDAASKRIFPFVTSSTETNALTGHSVTTAINPVDVDDYGNIKKIVKSYNNGVTETTENNYASSLNTTDWLVGRLGSSTVTYAKSGESSVSQSVRYTYNTDGIIKPDFIYFNEGTSLEYYKNYDYDNRGNVIQEYIYGASIDASQTNYSYTYNDNQIISVDITDPLGHVTTRTFDSYGRLYTEEDYLNNVVTSQYDNSDRPYVSTSTLGMQTTTTYHWTGTNKPSNAVYGITQTGNDGSVTTTWYDKLNRTIRTEKKGFSGSMILTDKEYNSKGQVSRVSDPYFAGSSVTWAETYEAYDAFGRVTSINRNTGRNTTFEYPTNRVKETTAGKVSWKDYDSQGLLTLAHDDGGDIIYTYFPDGKVKSITAPGGAVTSMEYNDAARNKTKLTDPSAGIISYAYNSFGKITSQIDARNRTTSYTYYPDGRINTRVTPEATNRITYNYNTNKQLTEIISVNVKRTYGYDTQGRVNGITETIDGNAFSTIFTFDSKGRLSTKKHPSGIVETLGYNGYGYLSTISAGGSIRYTITGMNAREQLTAATYGSNLTATFGYDDYGYPSSAKTGTVQDYGYVFNPVTGNLTSRQNVLRGKSESFSYDTDGKILDRLAEVTGPQNLTMTYADNGNLSTKSDIGTTAFSYGVNAGPYALTGVSTSTNIIPAVAQTITYDSQQKVSFISEANGSQTIQASFINNSDNQRAKMEVRVYYGDVIWTRYYVGNSYMKEANSGTTNEYTYLGGDAYTAPVAVKNDRGVITYYYLLRDYLGNITHLVNASSNAVTAEYSFDAWGRRRNATDWSYNLTGQPALFADRGFTGHEYLSWFKLYNMNGRLYDPAVGRFLNVDPYVQMPDNTQNFNRYSYCLNNPLKFTDPDGEWIWIPMMIIGAYIGGVSSNDGELNPTRWKNDVDTWAWTIMGGAVGALGGYGIMNPGTVELVAGIGNGYIYGGLTVGGATAGTGYGTNWDFNFNWTTSAGGGGNYNLNGRNTSPEQIGEQAVEKARESESLELSFVGAGLSIGQSKMYNRDSWFSIKQWKTYSQSFNGNGSTGGKIASAKTISNTLKWSGRGLGAYSAYSTNQQYQNGEINTFQMTLDQTSNALSTFGGLYGASWGIGWELGRSITKGNSYKKWKHNTWLPWRYENLGY